MTYTPITEGTTRTGRAPNPGHGGGQIPEGTTTSQTRTGRAANPGRQTGAMPSDQAGDGYTTRNKSASTPTPTYVKPGSTTIRNP